ncbi:MAG: ParB/RepB/Spo0J family partition protein [Asticcacaulis sp.]|nr:ParB/RepB/Spo0J family partition protein [Asticcacaulis sp.]
MTSISNKPVFQATLLQLAVAPENIRAGDDVDSEIDELAETLLAGQIQPLLVRAGGEKCLKDWLILDGRRRFLAYELLWQDGRIDNEFSIDCILCETPEEIAAAAIVANSARLEITKADYLLAVHRLMSQFKTPEEIGRILGVDAGAVRQVARLGSLDKVFLQAFKEDRISLKGLKQIARLKDADALSELKQRLEGDGEIHDYQLPDATRSALTAQSRLLDVFSLEDYTAAGGRIESDLFGELPDQLLDGQIAFDRWMAATQPIAGLLAEQGLQVHHMVVTAGDPPGTVALDYNYDSGSTYPERMDTDNAIESFKPSLTAALAANDRAAYIEALKDQALKRLDHAKVVAQPQAPVAAVVTFSQYNGLTIKFYADQAEYKARLKAKQTAPDAPAIRNSLVNRLKLPHARTRVDVQSYGTLLHQKVTSIAGKALACELAANPTAALDTQISAQFQQCLLHSYNSDSTTNLLKLSVGRIISLQRIDADDIRRPLVDRLKAWRDQYTASGLYPFEWVQSLDMTAKLELLALITALQVDTFEQKKQRAPPRCPRRGRPYRPRHRPRYPQAL